MQAKFQSFFGPGVLAEIGKSLIHCLKKFLGGLFLHPWFMNPLKQDIVEIFHAAGL
jgi:hypothetical protein